MSSCTPSDRRFFVLQAWLKYLPFAWAVGLRPALYRKYFAAMGAKARIFDGVTFKYPSSIRLGDNVTVNQGCFLAGSAGLDIGSDVMFGAGTMIVTSNHVMSRTDIPMIRQGLESLPICVGDDVWTGFNVVILPGVTIGQGCVLAAGTVVTQNVPEYSVVAGVPGRIIKTRTRTGA
jgi:maltose O-acetyltransferase